MNNTIEQTIKNYVDNSDIQGLADYFVTLSLRECLEAWNALGEISLNSVIMLHRIPKVQKHLIKALKREDLLQEAVENIAAKRKAKECCL